MPRIHLPQQWVNPCSLNFLCLKKQNAKQQNFFFVFSFQILWSSQIQKMSEPKTKRSRTTTAMSRGTDSGAGELGLQFAKSLALMAKKQDEFTRSVEQFNDLQKDAQMRIQELSRRLDDGQIELEKSERTRLKDIELNCERRKMELETKLIGYELDQAKKVLKDRKQIAIPQEQYEELIASLDSLQSNKNNILAEAEQKAQEKYKEKLNAQMEAMKYKNEAEVAKVTAKMGEQAEHIVHLKDTITALLTDLEQQRNLTRDVAGSQRPILSAPSNNNSR